MQDMPLGLALTINELALKLESARDHIDELVRQNGLLREAGPPEAVEDVETDKYAMVLRDSEGRLLLAVGYRGEFVKGVAFDPDAVAATWEGSSAASR